MTNYPAKPQLAKIRLLLVDDHFFVHGAANKNIATELGITEVTVKTHVSHIFEKMGVEDRTSATMAALQRGLVRQ